MRPLLVGLRSRRRTGLRVIYPHGSAAPPHSPETVWAALTDAGALGQWLMETDFVAEEGRAFCMWCEGADGGTDLYRCRVLALERPRRMVWSWLLEGREAEGETNVEFTLDVVPDGTRLIVRHSGDRDRATVERFKGGWPFKLDQLGRALETHAAD